ncbi:MAG: ATP-binding protein [Streptosporangiaceae bacterium]
MTLDFTSYLAERTDEFTGREWLFDAVAEWYADPGSGRCFLLTGEPGAGKTATAAYLASTAGFLDAVHFCSARDHRWINPRTFAESVSGQIAARHPSFAAALPSRSAPNVTIQQTVSGANTGQIVGVGTLVVDAPPEDIFDRLVRGPLEAVADPVVILIDALDESLYYSHRITIADLVMQSEHLRPTVRFVLTCRPDPELLRSLGRLGTRLCAMSPRDGTGYALVLHDVERYVAQLAVTIRLAPDLSLPEFIATVRDRSGGNFLYTRHLIHNLREQAVPVTRTALSSVPGSLDGVYLDFLRRLKSLEQRQRYENIVAVLAILAVVQQPSDERRLARYTGLPPATVRGALADLRQFMHTDDAAPASARTFALYHASFGELLLDAERAEEYWIDGAAAHHDIATAYYEAHRDDWSGCDDYGLNYLATHLFEAGDAGVLQTLVDTAWMTERRKRRNGSYDGVLSDVDLAWRAAESSDRSAVAASRPASLLAQELRWALAVASIGTRVLPTDLLARLALAGIWAPEQALGYARLNRSESDRIDALVGLALAIPEPFRNEAHREALADASSLPASGLQSASERRAAALARILPLLPPELRRQAAIEALGQARQLSDERRVAGGYGEYYSSGPGELFQHTGLRSTALNQLTKVLTEAGWPRNEVDELRAELRRVCDLTDGAAFEQASADLFARLADAPLLRATPVWSGLGPAPEPTEADREEVRRQLTEAASRMIGDADERAETATALASSGPTAGIGAGRQSTSPGEVVARAMREQSVSDVAWAPHDDPVGRLVELIRTAPSPYEIPHNVTVAAPYQAAVLTALAPRLPDDTRAAALEFAEQIGDPGARFRSIRALGPFLSERSLRTVLRSIRPDRRDAAERLAPLAGRFPGPLLLDALAVVKGIEDDTARVAALAVLVPHLPERDAGEAIAAVRAWLTMTAAADGVVSESFAAVARHLPMSLAPEAFTMLHERVGHDTGSVYRPERSFAATAMLALARQLPAPERAEALRFAQAAADRSVWQANTWGDANAQAAVTGALDLALGLPDSPERERLVGTLAEKAIAAVRTAWYGRGYESWNLRYQIALFVMLLPHLPEPYLSGAAEEVVRMIVERSADSLEANLTATLAAYLPEHLVPAIEPAITQTPVPLFLPESLLPAALEVARQRGNTDWLFAIVERGLLVECLAVAEEIGGPLLRVQLVTRHARRLARLPLPALHKVYAATLHGLACLDRPQFLSHLRDLGPILFALGGPGAIPAAVYAMDEVAASWP